MLDKLLEKLGLSEKEAKVYLATLELGKDTVQNLAKKAKIQRPTTYVILEKLLQLGLVSTAEEGKKTFFVAESPKELDKLLDKQTKTIDEHRTELGQVMNALLAIYNVKKDKPSVRYFEGLDGLIALDRYSIIDEQGIKGEELLTITPVDILENIFPARRQNAVSERVKAGIKARTIYTRDGGPFDEATDKRDLREGIYLERQDLPINMTIAIYSGGVKLFYLDANRPYGVLIEDREIARNLKVMFELAWLGAKSKSHK